MPRARDLPPAQVDWEANDRSLSNLGKAAIPGLVKIAKQKGWTLPPQLEDPDFHLTSALAFHAQQLFFAGIFPRLGPSGEQLDALKATVAQDLTQATQPEE
ncbi:MAG: hypothetical protein U0R64_01110 [Candidatus Nanopelagicales bacterium]